MNAILMLTKDAHKIVEELEAAWLYNTSRFTECPLVGISGTHLERWCNLLGIQLFHDQKKVGINAAEDAFDAIQSHSAEGILGKDTHRVLFPSLVAHDSHVYVLCNPRIPRKMLNPEDVLKTFYEAVSSTEAINYRPHVRPKKRKVKHQTQDQ